METFKFYPIKSIVPLGGYEILAHFKNGDVKKYDFTKLIQEFEPFKPLATTPGLFEQMYLSPGGYGIIWNDEIDLAAEEIWYDGEDVDTPFKGILAFKDATELWGLNESTLRKAVTYGKLKEEKDVYKFGNQWVITREAMEREYGLPHNAYPERENK